MDDKTDFEIQALCVLLEQITNKVKVETNQAVATNDHVAIIKHYALLRRGIERIREARRKLEDMEDNMSHVTVPEAMRVAGIKTTTIEDIGRVSIGHRFSCSMPDKELGMKWLRDNGHDGIIIQTVNSQTLAAFAREQLVEHGQELPQELFKFSATPYTSITRV